MIGTNSMMSNSGNKLPQQMSTGNMMSSAGTMNVNNPISGNNQMNSGNMMNANNQMNVGTMNNMVNPMSSNTGNQMQQQQQQQMNTGNMMSGTGTMNMNNQMQMANNPLTGNVATTNMASMSGGMTSMSNTMSSANVMGSNTSLASGMTSPASAVPSPIPGNMNNLGSPLQAGMGLKPGTQTPPANVLQVVKEVQEEAARQHGSFGKNLPGTGAMPPPMQRGIGNR